MGMTPQQVKRLMHDSGFGFVRDTHRGTFWTDGISQVQVPKMVNSTRAENNMRAEIKRAIARRPGSAIEMDPNALEPVQRFMGALKLKVEELLNRGCSRSELIQAAKELLDRAIPPEKEGLAEYRKGIIADMNEVYDKYLVARERHRQEREARAVSKVPVVEPELEVKTELQPTIQEEVVMPQEQTNEPPKAASAADEDDEILPVSRRFDGVTRHAIFKRIKEMVYQGHTYPQMTLRLRAEGFKMPNGEPFAESYVQYAVGRLRQNGELRLQVDELRGIPVDNQTPAPVAQQALPEPAKAAPPFRKKLPDAVVLLLEDPDLTDGEKVAMIRAYAGIR